MNSCDELVFPALRKEVYNWKNPKNRKDDKEICPRESVSQDSRMKTKSARKVELFYMHTLRHTYTPQAIKRSMQLNVIHESLGHANIRISMDRYNSCSANGLSKICAEHNP